MSKIKDSSLFDQGKMNKEIAEKNMPALLMLKNKYSKSKPFSNLTIGMALHVTKETAILVETLSACGAKIYIASCNPLSTQDDVAAYLSKQKNIQVFAYKGESKQDYYNFIENVVKANPDITIDDGCDLVTMIHEKYPEKIKSVIGGAEETTTGIIRLKAMEKDKALKYPIIAVNNNKTKHLTDNYYGTGQSTIDGVLRATNTLIAGKTFVVVGYGSCGKGVAMRARGMGANVIVTEVDYFAALQANLDGFRVMKMNEASKIGDVFITVTGNINVIPFLAIKNMKDGAILANSGHFNNEIDIVSLEKEAKSKKRVRPFLDKYTLVNGKNIFVAGEGRLVNLAVAEGHPSEIMDLSFCGQFFACKYLIENKGKLENKVYDLPVEIDNEIAKLKLEASGIKIDKLTLEQKKYLAQWKEGT